MSTCTNLGLIPYHLFHGHELDMSHLKIFESLYFVHVFHDQKKLDEKSMIGEFLGFASQPKDFQVYMKDKHRVVISKDVKFDKNFFFFPFFGSKSQSPS